MLFTSRHAADGRIVKRVLSGHAEDFGILVDRYLPAVQAVAYARVQNRAEAEDVAQETFVRAYEKLDSLKEGAKFGAWISTIARNLALRSAQKRAREVPLEEQHLEAPPRHGRDETLELLRECVDKLEEMPREIILLHYYAGKSIAEIAELLDISRDAVAKRLQRAREALSREVLSQIHSLNPEPKQLSSRKKAIIGAIGTLPVAWGAAAGAGTGVAAGSGAAASLAGKFAVTALALAAAGLVAWQAGIIDRDDVAAPVQEAQAKVMEPAAESATPEAAPESALSSKEVAAVANAEILEHGPGSISGRVLDLQEQPVAGATVTIEHVTWEENELPPAQTMRREATTDSEGRVTFTDLPLGTYGIATHAGDLADAVSAYLRDTRPAVEEEGNRSRSIWAAHKKMKSRAKKGLTQASESSSETCLSLFLRPSTTNTPISIGLLPRERLQRK